jgi:hypothetical protein
MICAKCKEPQAHRSHRAGFQDWFMGLSRQTPYRCQACKARFYVYRHGETEPTLRNAEEQRIMKIRRKYKWKQTKRQILAFSFGAILLLIAIYMILQQRIPPSE